jgi:hypothetical protein
MEKVNKKSLGIKKSDKKIKKSNKSIKPKGVGNPVVNR